MKKTTLKRIKELASTLPPSQELQSYSISKKGSELTANEVANSKIKIEPNKVYTTKGHFRIVTIDHYSKLKKAFGTYGDQGLLDYMDWLHRNNEKVKAIFNKIEQDNYKKTETNEQQTAE